jgi:hypothetical protein
MASTSQVFDASRIDKISKIMPNFTKVAQVGDSVLMGLEGDPVFPYYSAPRPIARVVNVSDDADPTVTLSLNDGSQKVVNSYTIAPNDVFEFTDESFANVLERERKQQEEMMREQQALHSKQQEQQELSRAESSTYRSTSSLETQIASLRAELDAERQLTRNFHNTYIASLHELANDVCKLDVSGNLAQFCRTFNDEYSRMQSRAEHGVYRGSTNKARNEEEEEESEQEQQEEEYEEEEQFGFSEDSLSADEGFDGQSDYF